MDDICDFHPIFVDPINHHEGKPTLQQSLQVFRAQTRIAQDAFQDFRMENFRGVKWNRSPLAFGILVDHVAAALARYRKPSFSSMEQISRAVRRWSLGIRQQFQR
jgi:hypothetical protein